MSKVISPVFHPGSGQWLLGMIDNHTARPLTREEIDKVIDVWNAAQEQAVKPHQKLAELLHSIGWSSPNDAQWTRLEDAMDEVYKLAILHKVTKL